MSQPTVAYLLLLYNLRLASHKIEKVIKIKQVKINNKKTQHLNVDQK